MGPDADVLFETRGRAAIVTLNRPRALNALTVAMVRALHAQLMEWRADLGVELVVIRAAGERAFCVGGDIREVRELGLNDYAETIAFFRVEYALNALIKRFPKPYVALIDGLVMGGGVGVSVHGSHRVCGERLAFAMPETGIGLFPDVGATYVLPRLPGRLGTYLALTGARLGRGDAAWCGIATHAAPRARFDDLVESLASAADPERAIQDYAVAPEPPAIPPLMPTIDRCFAGPSVEDIVEALQQEAGEHAEWASETAHTLASKSPLSLKIALRQMQEGKGASFEECIRIEFRIVCRVLQGHDF